MNEVQYDPELCCEFSKRNREEIKKSKFCGCYYCFYIGPAECFNVFSANETARCPQCFTNCVIPDSVMPSTQDNLRKILDWRNKTRLIKSY